MTITDRKAVVSLAKQLSSLPHYPFEEEGRRAVAAAFQDAFPDAAAVEAAIDELLRTNDMDCPTPAGVWALARAHAYQLSAKDHLAKIAEAQECDACDNTGWTQEERIVGYREARNDENQPIRVPITINVTRRCECGLGKAMAKA